MPDLIVFEVVEGHFVEPFDLFWDGDLQSLHNGEAVKPDGVVCWVYGNDVLRKAEAARGVLFLGHDGAEVGNGCQLVSVIVS